MSVVLHIQLENPRPYYAPGDKLTGIVVFTTTADRAIGKVEVTMLGRAKTKIVQHQGQSRRVYRGRATLFESSQTLFDDHYARKADTFRWPFTFTIPNNPTSRELSIGWRYNEAYLATNAKTEGVPLPSTFSTSGHGFGNRFTAFTEYTLQAQVTEPASTSIFKWRSTTEKIQPFRLLSTNASPSPITDHQLYPINKQEAFRTLRLSPEYADAKLSFSQKTRSILRPSTLPTYAVNLNVTVPQVLQVGGSTIPFHLSVTPNPSESSSLGPCVSRDIRLIKFSLATKACTSARAFGMFEHHASNSNTIEIFNTTTSTNIPVSTSAKSDSDGNQPPQGTLDLGSLFDIRIAPGKICPSFVTYNIIHKHYLICKMVLECAGESMTFEIKGSTVPLVVFGPPAGSLDDPDNTLEALPSYENPGADSDEDEQGEKDLRSPPGNMTKAEEARRETNGGYHDHEEGAGRISDEHLPTYRP